MKAETAARLCRKAKPKHENRLAFIDLLINSTAVVHLSFECLLCHIENTRYKTLARSIVFLFVSERAYVRRRSGQRS